MSPYCSLSSLMALEEDRQRQLERLYGQHRALGEARRARPRGRRPRGHSTVWGRLFGRRRQHSLATA
jgi:hypothetical protein